MNRQVLWSRDALDDLKHAIRFIADRNVTAARRIGAAIGAAGDGLAVVATGRPGRVSGTYEKVVRRTPYMLAYEIGPLPDGQEAVFILRVIHGARNWPEGEWPQLTRESR